MMRAIVTAMVCLGLLGLPLQARAAADPSCSSALQMVSAEWDAAGFPAPSKPSQTRECGSGNGDVAMKRLGVVHRLLVPAS